MSTCPNDCNIGCAACYKAIAVGDVVKLRSDGPRMTVHALDGDDGRIAQCVWFDRIDAFRWGEVRMRDFAVSDLTREDDDE